MPREPWPLTLEAELEHGPCVLVTVADIKGSAPRELGARMLVNADGFRGSIGGGNLEWGARDAAGRLLRTGAEQVQISDRLGLGPALNQCCGGAVTLLFEYCHSVQAPWLSAATRYLRSNRTAQMLSDISAPVVSKWVFVPKAGAMDDDAPPLPQDFTRARAAAPELDGPASQARVVATDRTRYLLETLAQPRLDLYLYGAGHVGKAVVECLRPLPFRVHWVDARTGEFPAPLPDNVVAQHCIDPVEAATASPPECLHLVMTHSHELDEDICHALLAAGSPRWLGLIGSTTKAARFRHRLTGRGITEAALQRLTCPVGLAGIEGKRPATIAVAIAAQLLAEQVPAGWK